MSMRGIGPDDGFTLLEMLVVLALLCVFAVTLAGSLRFGVIAEGHVSGRAAAADAVWRAERFLRDRLSDAQPVWIRDERKGHVDFAGDANRMEFLAPTAQSLGGIGFSRYQLAVDTGNAHARLLARVLTAHPGDMELADIGSVVLLADALSIRFAYYGKQPKDGHAAWQPSWNERSDMPQLVSIRAEDPAGEKGTVIDVIVRPRIDIDVDCELDVQTASCRGH